MSDRNTRAETIVSTATGQSRMQMAGTAEADPSPRARAALEADAALETRSRR